jgi:hypothetical protein
MPAMEKFWQICYSEHGCDTAKRTTAPNNGTGRLPAGAQIADTSCMRLVEEYSIADSAKIRHAINIKPGLRPLSLANRHAR